MLGDKPAGFRCNIRAAQLGDVEAEEIVGSLYYNCDGTSQDYKQAFPWFQKSAGHGNLGGLK